jgi:hypothetical protein
MNFSKIFNAVFFQRKRYAEIMREMFLSESTLGKRIKRFNNLATQFIIKKEKYIKLKEILIKQNFLF